MILNVILNHELRLLPLKRLSCSEWFAKVLPEIINGLGASFNFVSVKQLAIANFWSRADRVAFFLPLAMRFEVVTTSSTLPSPSYLLQCIPGYNNNVQITVLIIRYVHKSHRAYGDNTSRNYAAPSKSCPAWPNPALLSNGSNEANSSLMLLRA